MSIRKHWKLGAVAVSCAAIGAGASAIANAGASTRGSSTTAATKAKHAAGTRRALLRRAVHGDAVVATKSGYASVTFDRGTVKSVSGQQLTLSEGRSKGPAYKTVTVTIPTTARVRDSGHKATLADVKPGQRVVIIQAAKRTFVIARSTP
jgi:hypothetical protein